MSHSSHATSSAARLEQNLPICQDSRSKDLPKNQQI